MTLGHAVHQPSDIRSDVSRIGTDSQQKRRAPSPLPLLSDEVKAWDRRDASGLGKAPIRILRLWDVNPPAILVIAGRPDDRPKVRDAAVHKARRCPIPSGQARHDSYARFAVGRILEPAARERIRGH